MDYRSEARGVPNLLVAPPRDEINGDRGKEDLNGGDVRGYYEDGAYTALPAPGSTGIAGRLDDGMREEEDEDLDPQEAYYAALLDRFHALRSILHSPPPESTQLVPKYSTGKAIVSAATRANDLHRATHSQWRFNLTNTEPPIQVLACMGQEGVIRGLARLESILSKKNLHGHVSGKTLGAWCWGLLGKCKDLGEMSSEEVGVIRMVGKTALKLGRRLRMRKRMGQEATMQDVEEEVLEGHEESAVEGDIATDGNTTSEVMGGNEKTLATEGPVDDEKTLSGNDAENGDGDEQMEDGELDEMEDSAELLAKAKESMLSRVCLTSPTSPADGLHEEDIEARTFATLDMIVTIVGEFYGQRDLLDAREVWA